MDDHEPAAAEISRAGISDRQGKAGSHRRIDRIAAAFQHVCPDTGRNLFLRHDHAVFGGHWMDGFDRRRVIAAARFLRARRQASSQKKREARKDVTALAREGDHQNSPRVRFNLASP
jgi:hypothetical protein